MYLLFELIASPNSTLDMKEIQHFLTHLIDIPSITGEEYALSRYLRDFLIEKGMSVDLMPVEEDRYNLFAVFSDKPDVILTTHMDTVAPFIHSHIEKDKIFGRGACDAKGIMASMIYAVLTLEKDVRDRVGLLFVVGEETDSIGAKTAVKNIYKPRFFINGEPTENKLVHAQKGTYFFEVKACGKASHSGYPEHGESAIDKLLIFLGKLKKYNWPKNDRLGETLINIGKISGGEAINTLASEAKAECCIRIVSSASEITEILQKLSTKGIHITTMSASDSVELYCPAGIDETINVNYGSDVYYLQALARVLMIGPGSILNAHTENEHIHINELNEAERKYKELIKILLKEK